jgi:dUTPase
MKFERVTQYPNAILPTRGTEYAAGYDLYAAEDTVIPGYQEIINEFERAYNRSIRNKDIMGIDWT